MAEPTRLLKVLAAGFPLAEFAGRSAVPQTSGFIVIVGADAYGYAFADKAAALAHWRAQAGYVSDTALSTTVSAFVFTTDAGYVAGLSAGGGAFAQLDKLFNPGSAVAAGGLTVDTAGTILFDVANASCCTGKRYYEVLYVSGAKPVMGWIYWLASNTYEDTTIEQDYRIQAHAGAAYVTPTPFVAGDRFGLGLDFATGECRYHVNGVDQGIWSTIARIVANPNITPFRPCLRTSSLATARLTVNFGGSAFAYDPIALWGAGYKGIQAP